MQILINKKMLLSISLGTALLLIFGTAHAAGIFNKKNKSSETDNNPLPQIPFLGDAVTNEHQIFRISGYPGGNIRYIKSNNTFVIPTSLRFNSWINLWRVNADGILVDSFSPDGEYEGNLPDSGIFFRKENYIDWAYSGERSPKLYTKTWDATQLGKEKTRALLAQAKQIVWKQETYYEQIYRGMKETPEFQYFLKNDNGWSLLLSPSELTNAEYPELKLALNDDSRDGYAGPDLGVTMIDATGFDVKSPKSPIQLIAFKKIGESKSGFMDINSSAWIGDYGHGQFQWHVGNESIQFKSFHRVLKSYGSEGRDQPDMLLYNAANITHQNNELNFLVLTTGRAPARNDLELGSYILRKKITPAMELSLNTAQSNYVKNSQKKTPLSISIKGFEALESNLYWMTYFNGKSESFGEPNTREITSAPRSIPMEIRGSFDLPIKVDTKVSAENKKSKKTEPDNTYHNYALKLNDQYFSWSDARDIHYALHFDYEELVQIFNELSPANQPIHLILNAEFVKEGVELSASLSNDFKSMTIKKIRFASVASQTMEKDNAVTIFDKKLISDLKTIHDEYEIARNAPEKIPATLALMRKIVNASEYPTEFNSAVEDASWFLLNGAIAAKDDQLKVDVVSNYVVNLFPKTGVCPGLVHFVERAVNVAENTHNEVLLANINAAFFSPKTTIDYDKSQWLFEHGMLDQSFKAAMLNSNYIDNYLWLSSKLFKNNMEIEKLSPIIANHYTKLIIKAMTEKKYDAATKLSKFFMDDTYAKIGYSEKSTDVVSNIIVAGAITKNEALLNQVFTQFVNNLEYKTGTNNVLYFNIACYYATHANKEKMLKAIKTSLEYGHGNQSFLTDSDFNAFKNDPDFIAMVNTPPAANKK